MSLLKRNRKSKEEHGTKPGTLLEPPSSPSVFRKSTSLEPSGSHVEHSPSPQCTRNAGKKKLLPTFFSKHYQNLFGNAESNEVQETEANIPNAAVSKVSIENTAASHESINSISSSTSFSYVNPRKYGGKRVKGKRIPVDDPAYSSANNGRTDPDKMTAGLSTLDKIGMKIGLKKKYNLQSCESLEYIDACDESLPLTSEPSNPGKPLASTSKQFDINPSSPSHPKSFQVKKDESGHREILDSQLPIGNYDQLIKETPDIPKHKKSISCRVKVEKEIESKTCSPNFHETIVVQEVRPTAKKAAMNSSTKPSNDLNKVDNPAIETIANVIGSNSLEADNPSEVNAGTSCSPNSTNPVEVTDSQRTISTFSNDLPCPATSATTSSLSPICIVNANTWSNSTRRKRRAPQPPSSTDSTPRGLTNSATLDRPTCSASNSSNKESASSSKNAQDQVKKFTQPPINRQRDKFEIRPRKKEMSAEPMTVTYQAQASSTAHCLRYKHKRSCSDSTTSNSNTKNRIHKFGKKKAPPPPNPFGDPDASNEECENIASSPVSPTMLVNSVQDNTSNDVVGTSTSEVLTQAVPTNLPQIQSSTQAMVASYPLADDSQTPRTLESEHGSPIRPSIHSITNISPSPTNAGLTTPQLNDAGSPETETEHNQSIEQGCLPDLVEEIRQNMLNDQLELTHQNIDSEQVQYSSGQQCPREYDIINTITTEDIQSSERISSASLAQPTGTGTESSNHANTVIMETDVISAQRTLEALSASMTGSSAGSSRVADASSKTKLVELKRDAEKSPLYGLRNKPRPISIGSSIYENPLALLLSKATGSSGGGSSNNQNNVESSNECTGGSPKVPHRPWYGALARQLTPSSKLNKAITVKPFTALVKFSELDKEAALIVEENRKKSAEQRQLETEKELLELFSGGSEDGCENRANAPSQNTPFNGSSHHAAEISTTVQVHSVMEETDESTTQASLLADEQSSNSSNATNANNAGNECDVVRPTVGSRPENCSSTTFESVHAASKHRKVKPLVMSSPIAKTRSEKSAIVQPQTNTAVIEADSVPSTNNSFPITPALVPSTAVSVNHSNANASGENEHNSGTASGISNRNPISPRVHNSSFAVEWDCPRCTLKNPSWRILCEVCFQRKDPPSSASNLSSILERVNAASNNVVSTTSAALSTAIRPSTTKENNISSKPALLSVPSTKSNAPANFGSNTTTVIATATTSTSIPTTTFATHSSTTSITNKLANVPSTVVESCHVLQQPPSDLASTKKATHNASAKTLPDCSLATTKHPNPDIPPCENFLSQLPANDDFPKEHLKLHDDPELEELDIDKLRKARLAYFQKQQSLVTIASTNGHDHHHDESKGNPTNKTKGNDWESSSQQPQELHNQLALSSKTNEVRENSYNNDTVLGLHTRNTFADDEDGSLDSMLMLQPNSAANAPETHINKDTIPAESTSTSLSSEIVPNDVVSTASSTTSVLGSVAGKISMPSDSLFKYRTKPKLTEICENSSQEYMYCYSSTEIAQIYKNWQVGNKFRVGSTSFVPNSSQNCEMNTSPTPGKSLAQTPNNHIICLQEPASTSPSLLHHHHFNLHNSLIRANRNVCRMTCDGSNAITTFSVPILPVLLDHQPYANNRFSESLDKEYANASVLNQDRYIPPSHLSNSKAATSFTTCFSCPSDCNVLLDNNNLSEERQNLSCERNKMNVSPNGNGRACSYDKYRKIGAKSEEFAMHSRNTSEEWSNGSSSDSSIGLSFLGDWGRRYTDSSPGITHGGTLDGTTSPSFGLQDKTIVVSKLTKRLETAIANGEHRVAAMLAHDLALLKTNCIAAKINKSFSIRVYVEDRFMQQGPFLVQVSSMMSILDLKTKVERDWGIPIEFQKWILGRQIAEDDNHSLASFEITHDSMAFLFLVTPKNTCETMRKLPPENTGISSALNKGRRSVGNDVHLGSEKTTFHNNLMQDKDPITYNNVDIERVASTPSSKQLLTNSPTTPTKPQLLSTINLLPQSTEGNTSSSVGLEQPNPPPLPPKSPIPSGKANVNIQLSSPSASVCNPSKPKIVRNAKKESLEDFKQVNASERLTGASALTHSLQQKLSEFKAVAEQTFGKVNSNPTVSPKQLRREKSHTPPVTRIHKAHETSPGVLQKATGKATPRKSKSQQSQSINQKMPSNCKSTGRDDISVTSAIPENRFNGILLQTPKEDAPIEPPERLDRKKSAEPSKKETPSQTDLIHVGKASEHTKVLPNTSLASKKAQSTQVDDDNSKVTEKLPKSTSPTKKQNTALIEETTSSGLGESCSAQLDVETAHRTESPAPQPKPRGIKKQLTIEKVNHEIEASTKTVTAPTSNVPPMPIPSATVKPEKSHDEGLQEKTSGESSDRMTKENGLTEGELKQQNVDDYCQTTLPFPTLKTNWSAIAPSLNIDNSKDASQQENGIRNLLRPSAFVSDSTKHSIILSHHALPQNVPQASTSVLLPSNPAAESIPPQSEVAKETC